MTDEERITEGTAALDAVKRDILAADQALLNILAIRFRLTRKLAIMKSELNIATSDHDFHDHTMMEAVRTAAKINLDPPVAEAVFKEIVRVAHVHENTIWWEHIEYKARRK